ncbi:MAG: hypothetical protein AB8G77_23425 [Rhodothermales bacterium]
MHLVANWIIAQFTHFSFISSENKNLLSKFLKYPSSVLIAPFLAIASLCPQFVEAQSEERLHSALESVAPDKTFEVSVGVQVEQIVSVNQKAENFEVVGNIRLQWIDPKLAFEPGELGRPFRLYTREKFIKFIEDNNIFAPIFTIHNQQGRRFTQNSGVMVFSDGHASFSERFTVQLQAPEFNFVQYPFDTQKFFVHVRSVLPKEFMRFVPMEEFSRLGDQLGEEEWIFDESWTNLTEVEGISGKPTTQFSFGFAGHRHLNYYILRIFVPLVIIILVSWLTFFLQDFSKRIDIAGANLLIFVAFNFTISGDLPRLGYMTFMDAIVLITFIFSSLVVITNVIFRRMEVFGRERLARRIDSVTIWAYPFTLAALAMLCWYWFVVKEQLP